MPFSDARDIQALTQLLDTEYPTVLAEAVSRFRSSTRGSTARRAALIGLADSLVRYLTALLYAAYRDRGEPHPAAEGPLGAGTPTMASRVALLAGLLEVDDRTILACRFDGPRTAGNPFVRLGEFVTVWQLAYATLLQPEPAETLEPLVRRATYSGTQPLVGPVGFLQAVAEYASSAAPPPGALALLLEGLLEAALIELMLHEPVHRALTRFVPVRVLAEHPRKQREAAGTLWLQEQTGRAAIFAGSRAARERLGEAPGYLVRKDPRGQSEPVLWLPFDWERWRDRPEPLTGLPPAPPQDPEARLGRLTERLRSPGGQLGPDEQRVLRLFAEELGLTAADAPISPAPDAVPPASRPLPASRAEARPAARPPVAPLTEPAPSQEPARRSRTTPGTSTYDSLSAEARQILDLLVDGLPHARRELADPLNISAYRWRVVTEELLATGWVLLEGERRSSTYRLKEPGRSLIQAMISPPRGSSGPPRATTDEEPARPADRVAEAGHEDCLLDRALTLLADGQPRARSMLLQELGLSDFAWPGLMKELLASGRVVREGERRYTVYRLSESAPTPSTSASPSPAAPPEASPETPPDAAGAATPEEPPAPPTPAPTAPPAPPATVAPEPSVSLSPRAETPAAPPTRPPLDPYRPKRRGEVREAAFVMPMYAEVPVPPPDRSGPGESPAGTSDPTPAKP
ncbi:MAG: hypothetical protein RBU45_14700 [Myxococcota bacterium]|jgi:hypothetical protein|nr:hypothetical protein [Myxococcota bacterium]